MICLLQLNSLTLCVWYLHYFAHTNDPRLELSTSMETSIAQAMMGVFYTSETLNSSSWRTLLLWKQSATSWNSQTFAYKFVDFDSWNDRQISHVTLINMDIGLLPGLTICFFFFGRAKKHHREHQNWTKKWKFCFYQKNYILQLWSPETHLLLSFDICIFLFDKMSRILECSTSMG